MSHDLARPLRLSPYTCPGSPGLSHTPLSVDRDLLVPRPSARSIRRGPSPVGNANRRADGDGRPARLTKATFNCQQLTANCQLLSKDPEESGSPRARANLGRSGLSPW